MTKKSTKKVKKYLGQAKESVKAGENFKDGVYAKVKMQGTDEWIHITDVVKEPKNDSIGWNIFTGILWAIFLLPLYLGITNRLNNTVVTPDPVMFNDAFKNARIELGANGVFNWNGNDYHTMYVDEINR